MYQEEIKAYQEQLSSLNELVVDLQQDIYRQKQNIEILENDLLDTQEKNSKEYKEIFEQNPNIMVVLDKFGKIKKLNNSAINFFEKRKYILVENSFRKFLDHIVFNEFTTQFNNFIKEEKFNAYTLHFLQLKDKKTFSMTLKKIVLGDTEQIVGLIFPYDETDSQRSNYLSHIVLDQLRDGVIITDDKGKILRINNAFIEITGYTVSEVLGKTPRILKSFRHSSKFYEKMWYDIAHHGWWSGEIWNKRKNGEVYPEWLQINRVVEPITKKVFYTSIFSDISERKKRQAQLDRLAHYDTLTGLVNRHFLQISLSNLLEKSSSKNTKNAILFLDLDHFKQVNDIYGHHEGDLLLQEAAQRILATVRTSDIVARVGGDEFIVVLSRIKNEEFINKVAQSLIKELRRPFFINNNEHTIGASIGVAIYPQHGINITELMSRADSAMYRSKNSGRNQVSIFKIEDEQYIQEKDSIKNLLLKTIKKPSEHLEVYYQPIIKLKDESLCSLEALLRIKDEKGEFVNPEQIIYIAETEGLINELGDIIFNEICKFMSSLKNLNYKNVPIAVNLSVLQLGKTNFIDSFENIVSQYNLELKDFNFEITETRAMENLDNLFKTLLELKGFGCEISLDDFGTGYASLSQLHNLPVDIVKIDKSFTFRIDNDIHAKNMVKAMVLMTKGLNCKVIIEGVETKENIKWLREIGVDFAQGYYFSKPLNKTLIKEKYLK